MELVTLEQMFSLCQRKLLESSGDTPPAEAEENDYRQLARQIATVAV